MKKLILAFLLVSGVFLNTSAAGDKQEVENFVSRFYTEVLGRTADTAGLADWTNRLVSGESAGSDVATGFIFSKEFTESPEFKNSETYVTTLYRAFFNRDADTGGLNGWLSELSKGKTKKEVLDGFLFSTEFANLCKAYGIKPVPDGATGGASGGGVEDFVKRFYAVVLGRTADAAGLADWVNKLNTKVSTGADIATGFVFSAEFDESSKDDDAFLKVLYKAFFNRAADEGGLNGWLSELSKGTSRQDVLNGFLHSQEFVNLCEGYGILAYTMPGESMRDLVVRSIVGTWKGECNKQEENEYSIEHVTFNADGSSYWHANTYSAAGCSPQDLIKAEEAPLTYTIGSIVKASDGADAVELSLDAPGNDDWYSMVRFNDAGNLLEATGNGIMGTSPDKRANDFSTPEVMFRQ